MKQLPGSLSGAAGSASGGCWSQLTGAFAPHRCWTLTTLHWLGL